MKRLFLLLALGGVLILTTACGAGAALMESTIESPQAGQSSADTEQATNAPQATATPASSATPLPTDTPAPTDTPTPTPTMAPLTSKEIFEQVSPSVAYVETDLFTGSGVLLENGMILTSAHVVWPYDEARIIFPDGTEFNNVPVANRDMLVDLAVLGPVETEIPSAELIALEDLRVASDVYLIGYPGEVEAFPKPSITRGLVSRVRDWEPTGVTFYQTDAAIAGGQSGGVLVSENGEVIGLSGHRFSEADFGLVASARDILPRVERLLAGEDLDGLQGRGLPAVGGDFKHSSLGLHNDWDSLIFLMKPPLGEEVTITAQGGPNDIMLQVSDIFGNLVAESNRKESGEERVRFVADLPGIYYALLFPSSGYPLDLISIEATTELLPLDDPDDGRRVEIGSTVYGNLDYIADTDYYILPLLEGEQVNLYASSIFIDPVILIAPISDGQEVMVGDDDSGGGMFGLDAELSFVAPESGDYLIVAMDTQMATFGGYTLAIREPYEGAPTPTAPQPTPEPILTDFGEMAVYDSVMGDLLFLYPKDWTDAAVSSDMEEQVCSLATICFAKDDAVLIVAEEDLSALSIETLDEYVDLYVNLVEGFGGKVLAVEDFVTDSGLAAKVLTVDFAGLFTVRRLLMVQDDLGFNVSYLVDPDTAAEIRPLAEFSFSTVTRKE